MCYHQYSVAQKGINWVIPTCKKNMLLWKYSFLCDTGQSPPLLPSEHEQLGNVKHSWEKSQQENLTLSQHDMLFDIIL